MTESVSSAAPSGSQPVIAVKLNKTKKKPRLPSRPPPLPTDLPPNPHQLQGRPRALTPLSPSRASLNLTKSDLAARHGSYIEPSRAFTSPRQELAADFTPIPPPPDISGLSLSSPAPAPAGQSSPTQQSALVSKSREGSDFQRLFDTHRKTVKSLLRRKQTKYRIQRTSNPDLSPVTTPRGVSQPATSPPSGGDSPEIPARSITLFRVRLQDDNYKTLTIERDTTARILCTKLYEKMCKERPEQVWEGCVLVELVEGRELMVDNDTVLFDRVDGREYLFKRLGEQLANHEAELQRIIEQKRIKDNHLKSKLCEAWFCRDLQTFAEEDLPIVHYILDTLMVLAKGEVEALPPSQTGRDYCTQLLALNNRKKAQTLRKPRKRQSRINLDSSRIQRLALVAEGGGSYARIYSVMVDGMMCAMKELILDETVDPSAFLTEIAVFDALPHHPNLARYFFHEKQSGCIRLFMTLYDDSLQSVLKQRRLSPGTTYPVFTLREWATSISNGIDYLHYYFIAHRDLKSGNVFVNRGPNGCVTELVIADFDTAIQVESEKTLLRQTMGTPGFMAPEVLQARECGYNLKCDIFSFGMILFELLFLTPPYSECDNSYEISDLIISGTPPKEPFPLQPEYDPFYRLYQACTDLDPENRPSSQQLIELVALLPTTKEESPSRTNSILSTLQNIRGKSAIDELVEIKNPLYQKAMTVSSLPPASPLRSGSL